MRMLPTALDLTRALCTLSQRVERPCARARLTARRSPERRGMPAAHDVPHDVRVHRLERPAP